MTPAEKEAALKRVEAAVGPRSDAERASTDRQLARLERRLAEANEEAFHARADLRAARASQDRAEKRTADLEAQLARVLPRSNQTEHVLGILRRIVDAHLRGDAGREISAAHGWLHRTGEIP